LFSLGLGLMIGLSQISVLENPKTIAKGSLSSQCKQAILC
jgi:hypothetical protein